MSTETPSATPDPAGPITTDEVHAAPTAVPTIQLAFECPHCKTRRVIGAQQAVVVWLSGRIVGLRCAGCAGVVRLAHEKRPLVELAGPTPIQRGGNLVVR